MSVRRSVVLSVAATGFLLLVFVVLLSEDERGRTAGVEPVNGGLQAAQGRDFEMRELRITEERPIEADPGAEPRVGTVSFLWAHTGQLAEATRWTLDSDSGQSLRCESTCQVSPGRWHVASEDPSLTADPTSVDVLEREDVTIWVATKGALDVLVLSQTSQEAIPNARVDYVPRMPGASGTPLSAVTDEAGRVTFEDAVTKELFTLGVTAHGYRPAYRNVSGRLNTPLVVHLVPDTSEVALRVVGADDEAPMQDVRIVLPEAGELGVTDETGVVAIPAWAEDDFLIARGACFPWRFRIDECEKSASGPRVLRVPRSASGTLLLRGSHSARVRIWYRNDSQLTGSPEFEVEAEVPEDGKLHVAAPASCAATVFGVDEVGAAASAVLHVSTQGWFEALNFDDADALLLDLGEEFPARAITHYAADAVGSSPSAWIVESRRGTNGLLRIPFAERVSTVKVVADGFLDAQLRPFGDVPKAGRLKLALARGHPVDFRLYSHDGLPMRRSLRVTASPERTGFFEHPERFGGWPTSHPGWSREREPIQTAVTDHRGHGTIKLHEGKHTVEVRELPWWPAPDWGTSLYQHEPVDVYAPSAKPLRIYVPTPRLCTLEVFEEESGLPIESFRVGTHRLTLLQRGHAWQGWINADETHLTVCSNGHARDMPLPVGDEPVTLRVEL